LSYNYLNLKHFCIIDMILVVIKGD